MKHKRWAYYSLSMGTVGVWAWSLKNYKPLIILFNITDVPSAPTACQGVVMRYLDAYFHRAALG